MFYFCLVQHGINLLIPDYSGSKITHPDATSPINLRNYVDRLVITHNNDY